MKTKKGDKEKLRNKILTKAVSYFKKNGRVGSVTEDIMEYAGLTKGALYSHFKSKDELFVQAIIHDLKNLTTSIDNAFKQEGQKAFESMINEHLNEKNLTDVSDSCVFTSLSSDMQRCKASQRALFEPHLEQMFLQFAEGFKMHFPNETTEARLKRAHCLYSGLVGTLTMARTMKDHTKALKILEDGKEFLTQQFTN